MNPQRQSSKSSLTLQKHKEAYARVMTGDNVSLNLLLGNVGLRLGGGAAGQGDAFLGETHFLGKCTVWNPFGGCAGGGLFQHLVDLLE